MPRFVIATSKGLSTLTRGKYTSVKDITLNRFWKNPVMLFNHGFSSSDPIGHWTNITLEGDQLTAEANFSSSERGKEIEGMVNEKTLRGASIGANRSGDTLELFEVSIVTIPAIADALKLGIADESETYLSHCETKGLDFIGCSTEENKEENNLDVDIINSTLASSASIDKMEKEIKEEMGSLPTEGFYSSSSPSVAKQRGEESILSSPPLKASSQENVANDVIVKATGMTEEEIDKRVSKAWDVKEKESRKASLFRSAVAGGLYKEGDMPATFTASFDADEGGFEKEIKERIEEKEVKYSNSDRFNEIRNIGRKGGESTERTIKNIEKDTKMVLDQWALGALSGTDKGYDIMAGELLNEYQNAMGLPVEEDYEFREPFEGLDKVAYVLQSSIDVSEEAEVIRDYLFAKLPLRNEEIK